MGYARDVHTRFLIGSRKTAETSGDLTELPSDVRQPLGRQAAGQREASKELYIEVKVKSGTWKKAKR